MKKLATFTVVVMLTGCSTFSENKNDVHSVTTEFVSSSIKVTYTREGDVELIQSTGAARITSNLPSAREEAASIAVLKARRQLAEFIKVELESDRFVATITNSLQRTNDGQTDINSNIAYDLKENIKQKSNAILMGTMVESERYDEASKSMVVVVRASPRDRKAMNQMRGIMGMQ